MNLRRLVKSPLDVVLPPILRLLPLGEIRVNAWFDFLEAEKENVASLDFNVLKVHESEGLDLNMSNAYRQLADVLESQDCLYDSDVEFWNLISRFTLNDLNSQPDDTEACDIKCNLVNEQKLFLLLVQSIFSSNTDEFLAATRLYLFLCRLPSAEENFFTPTLFVFRQIVSPLRVSVSSDPNLVLLDGQVTSDPKNNSTALDTLHCKALSLGHQDIFALLTLLDKFLKSVSLEFLQSEFRRELITLAVEYLVLAMLDKEHEKENRQVVCETLLMFLQHLYEMRQEVLKNKSYSTSKSLYSQSSDILRVHGLFVPFYCRKFSIDIFLYFISCVLRPLSFALACRNPSDSFVGQYTTVPKRVLMAREMAQMFIRKLLVQLPAVADPEEFYIHNNEGESGLEDESVDNETLESEGNIVEDQLGQQESVSTQTNQLPESLMSGPSAQERLNTSCRDPICACLARSCLLVPDRRECRELLASGIVGILFGGYECFERNTQGCDTSGWHFQKLMEQLTLRFSQYLEQLMHTSKLASFRTTSLDVAKALIEYLIQAFLQHKAQEKFQEVYSSGCGKVSKSSIAVDLCCSLVRKIAERVGDVQSGTRARALECLASFITTISSSCGLMTCFANILTCSHLWEGLLKKTDFDIQLFLLFFPTCFPSICLVHSKDSIKFSVIIYDRIKDERQVVRKSVVLLIRSLGIFFFEFYRYGCLSIQEFEYVLERHGILDQELLHFLCTDSSLQVRCKTISILQDFLGVAPVKLARLHRLWLSFVVPAIRDPEKSVVEKAVDLITITIVEGISQIPDSFFSKQGFFSELSGLDHSDTSKPLNNLLLPWFLLQSTTVEDLDYLGRFFILFAGRENRVLNDAFVHRLELFLKEGFFFSTLKQDGSSLFNRHFSCLMAVTFMVKDLVEFRHRFKIKSEQTATLYETLLSSSLNLGQFLLSQATFYDTFEDALQDDVQYKTFPLSFASRFLHESLYAVMAAKEYNIAVHDRLDSVWKKILMEFKAPLPLITPVLKCLLAMNVDGEQETVSNSRMKLFAVHFEERIELYFEHLWSSEVSENSSVAQGMPYEFRLIRGLFTLGDLILLSDYRPTPSLLKKVQTLVLDRAVSGDQKSSAIYQKLEKNGLKIFQLIRSQAVLFLGKLSMVESQLAKQLIDFLAMTLRETETDVVVCNSLAVFSDFCVRYAFLADSYLLDFSLHLGSGGPSFGKRMSGARCNIASPLIRKQCLCLLGGLVAQDFVKCKGHLIFRILSCLGDPHPVVKALAETITKHILMPRQANFIQNHLVEMLCFMCSWPDHPLIKSTIPNASGLVRKGSRFCYLHYPERRQRVYSFFLKFMTDKDRHELSRRLIHDFLGAFVDTVGEIPLYQQKRQLNFPTSSDDPAGSALRDALRLLGCKQMKITFHRHKAALSRNGLDDPEFFDGLQENETSTVQGTSAPDLLMKNAYETDLLKRNLAYQILPTLLSLKRVMEDARSPFLGDIIQCFRALLFDYRDELSDILFHDPILAKQLEFDFKRNTKNCEHDLLDLSLTEQKNLFLSELHNTGGRRSLLLDTTGYTGASVSLTLHPGDSVTHVMETGLDKGQITGMNSVVEYGKKRSCSSSHLYPTSSLRQPESALSHEDTMTRNQAAEEFCDSFPSPQPLDSHLTLNRSHDKKLFKDKKKLFKTKKTRKNLTADAQGSEQIDINLPKKLPDQGPLTKCKLTYHLKEGENLVMEGSSEFNYKIKENELGRRNSNVILSKQQNAESRTEYTKETQDLSLNVTSSIKEASQRVSQPKARHGRSKYNG